MAVQESQPVDALPRGTHADSPTKGSFGLNVFRRHNALEVRSGFGQVAELDTTFGYADAADAGSAQTFTQGYRRHLGSTLISTRFGHDQVVSVLSASVYTGNSNRDSQPNAYESIFIVSIYDHTTGDSWEEPLVHHTSEMLQSADSAGGMDAWHGHYETNDTDDFQRWIRAPLDNEKHVFFTWHEQKLFFGNTEMGLWMYVPCIFRGRRRRQLQSIATRDNAVPYSEGSVVQPVMAVDASVDGEFSGFDYLEPEDFPKPSAMCSYYLRLVIAAERTIYLSDDADPAAFALDNVFEIGTTGTITAVAEHNGNLYIWTERETWLCQPSPGFNAGDGRLTRLSETIGCSHQAAVTKTASALVWVDSNGVYASSGGGDIQTISQAIDPFFTSEVANPLTAYFVTSGHLTLGSTPPNAQNSGDEQARTFLRFDPYGVSATWSQSLELLFITVPEQNVILCLSQGEWYFWSVESVAYVNQTGLVPIPGRTNNIQQAWVLTDKDKTLLVGGVDRHFVTNTTLIGGLLDFGFGRVHRSYYILEYGRGGAIDRSVENFSESTVTHGGRSIEIRDEDMRDGLGWYENALDPTGSGDGNLIIGPPIQIPEGVDIGSGIVGQTMEAGSVLVPFYLIKPTLANGGGGYTTVEDLELELRFDNTHWQPIFRETAGPETSRVAAIFPPARAPSFEGYGYSTLSVPTSREFHVYNNAASARTTAGNLLRIYFDGAPATTFTWTTKPDMSLNSGTPNLLFYIPFRPGPFGGAVTTAFTHGMGWSAASAVVSNSRGETSSLRVTVWHPTRFAGSRRSANDRAQPVDYAVKTAPIAVDASTLARLRGVSVRALSHGDSATDHRVLPEWPFRTLNVLVGADRHGWVTQYIHASQVTLATRPTLQNVQNVTPIRSHYFDSATSAVAQRVFDGGATGPVWGTAGSTESVDRFLIDEEEVNDAVISTSTYGESVDVMVYGHHAGKAERTKIEALRVDVRPRGGARRHGR